MLISHTHRCIFMHIPKCAGSSIKNSLNLVQVNPPHWHCTWQEARALLGEEILASYYKFTIVRNPWDRVISAWKMFEQKPWCYHRPYSLGEFLAVVTDPGLDYRSTYQTPTEQQQWERSPENIRHHTLPGLHPYYGVVNETQEIAVDFVGRFETLERDFHAIAQHLGQPHLTLGKNNETHHQPYRDYYDLDSIATVRHYYQDDWQTFGYAFE